MGRAARQYAEAKEKLEQQLAAAEALLGDVIKREGGQAQELSALREEAQQLKEEGTERVDRWEGGGRREWRLQRGRGGEDGVAGHVEQCEGATRMTGGRGDRGVIPPCIATCRQPCRFLPRCLLEMP